LGGAILVPMAYVSRFESESAMTSAVLNWLQDDRLAVKTEFHSPWGVCDLVGLSFRHNQVRCRLSYGQKSAIGPALRIQVLSKIPEQHSGKTISFHSLHAKAFASLSRERLESELEHLVRKKFVLSPSAGRFQKLNGWLPLHKRIVAVELKLSRVSEAIQQAQSNLAFATESYIALPMDQALRVATNQSRRTAIRRMGVGLLGVGVNTCERIFGGLPIAGVADEILQAHCVERFWRTRDNSP
jgi:hypothetical protein